MLLAWNRWLSRAASIIADSAPALDAMNVFPVSDSDTGTNLRLTLSGIERAVPDLSEADLDAMVKAAILSAHGNSGAIVAEMFASVCRALEHGLPGMADGGTRIAGGGGLIAHLLRTVAVAANRAVARPMAGTILTVADATADAAEAYAARSPRSPLGVALAAQRAAREALARTPEQLDVLARAGVVDAGGQAFVLLLDVLVEVLGGPSAEPLPLPARGPAVADRQPSGRREYEVMYTLEAVAEPALDALRTELSVLGRSVVIVGDRALAQVHVHLTDAGAAVEAGLGHGRPRRIRITVLDEGPAGPERVVLSLVNGTGIADLTRAAGAVAVEAAIAQPAASEASARTALAGELAAALGDLCGDAVVLVNGLLEPDEVRRLVAVHAADRRVEVIESAGQIAGLAAVAVHEPSADFEAAVDALRRAIGLREGAVRAHGPEFTAVTGGVVVGRAATPGSAAESLLGRLVDQTTELVTLVVGLPAFREVAEDVADSLRRARPELEVEIVDGGPPGDALLVGVE